MANNMDRLGTVSIICLESICLCYHDRTEMDTSIAFIVVSSQWPQYVYQFQKQYPHLMLVK